MPYFVDFAVSCPQSLCIFYILTEVFVLSVFYHVGVSPLWTTITQTPPFSPGSSIQGLSHLKVNVEDVDEAAEYYKRVLGFQSPGDSRLGLVNFISYLGSGQEAQRKEDGDCHSVMHPSGITLKLTRIVSEKRELESIIGIALHVDNYRETLHYLSKMDSKDYQILQTFPIKLEDEMDTLAEPGDKDGQKPRNTDINNESMEKDEDLGKAVDTNIWDEVMDKAGDTDHGDEVLEKATLPLTKSIQWMDRYGIIWEFREGKQMRGLL